MDLPAQTYCCTSCHILGTSRRDNEVVGKFDEFQGTDDDVQYFAP